MFVSITWFHFQLNSFLISYWRHCVCVEERINFLFLFVGMACSLPKNCYCHPLKVVTIIYIAHEPMLFDAKSWIQHQHVTGVPCLYQSSQYRHHFSGCNPIWLPPGREAFSQLAEDWEMGHSRLSNELCAILLSEALRWVLFFCHRRNHHSCVYVIELLQKK